MRFPGTRAAGIGVAAAVIAVTMPVETSPEFTLAGPMSAAPPLAAMPIASTQRPPARPVGLYASGLKRLCDLVVCSVVLVGLTPVLVATAAIVWLTMGRPVFYLDRRSGRDGVPFTLVKFRSMRPVPTDAAAESATPADDESRLTPLGRLLRRTSLDELPQLINVLIGDMSLIGPRPLPERYLGRFSSRESARLLVRPGLSGWAQIHGRNEIDWPERLDLDVHYVEMLGRWYAPFVDLWIAARTVVQVVVQAITGRGVSAPGSATMPEYLPGQPIRGRSES